MKLLPKKVRKQMKLKREPGEVELSGRKGGRVKKERLEARMIDRELQQYAYR